MDRSPSSVSHLYWHRRRWGKALILSLMLAAGAIALVVCLQTPMYRAIAIIMIESSAPDSAFSSGGELGSSERYVETQKELLFSSVVLLPVIGRPEIAALSEIRNHGKLDPLQHLQEHLTFSQVGHSDLYEIAYESPSPQGAADLVNATLAEYLAIQSDEEYRRTRRTIDMLEEERRRRSLNLEHLRQKVVDLAKDVPGRDPFSFRFVPSKNDPSVITRIHDELLDINIERGATQDELRYYRQSINHSPEGTIASELSGQERENQPEILSWRGVLNRIDTLLKAIGEIEGSLPEHSELVSLAKDMEDLKDALGDQKKELAGQLNSTEHSSSQLQSIAKLEKHLKKLDIRNEHLIKSIQLEYAKAELSREENTFEVIVSRKLALQTELRAPTRVRLCQEARVPKISIAPLSYKALVVSCLAIFVVLLAIAFLLPSSK